MAFTKQGRRRVTAKVRGVQIEKHFPLTAKPRHIEAWKQRERVRLSETHPAIRRGTLAKDVETYLATLVHRPALKIERTRHLKFWTDLFGEEPRHNLTAPMLRAALADLRQRKQASTCNHVRIALSHLWTTLDGKNAPNPLRDVPAFEEPEPEPRDLPYHLIDRILSQMIREWGPKGEKRPQKTKARLRVMADTGLTPAQMMRLRPEDLRLEDAAVYVRRRLKGKGAPGSLKPLSKAGVDALRGFVVADAFGPWSVQSANKAWKRACEEASRMPETTDEERTLLLTARLYDLRHSFGTMVFRLTGNMHTTGELLDHRSAKTTRRYALGAIPAHLKAAIDAVSAGTRLAPDPNAPESK